MPTYEYRCKDCGHELDAVQGFHDDPLTECPTCGGNLKKKFGSVGISFKGSGFYKNDSRSTSSTSETSSSSSSDSSSSSTADSSSSTSGDSSSGSSESTKSTEPSKSSKSGSSDSGSKSKTPAAT